MLNATVIKRFCFILTMLIVLFLLLYMIPIRNKINITLDGIQGRIGEPNYSKDLTITIEGLYDSYLLKNDRFKGSIKVENYEFTGLKLFPFVFEITDSFSPLFYVDNNSGVPKHKSLGMIYTTPLFKELFILVSEPIQASSKSWTEDTGLYISAPANNLLEAERIVRNHKDMANIDWQKKRERSTNIKLNASDMFFDTSYHLTE